MDWRLSTPGRVTLVGPSQCGKSTLILQLVGDDTVWDRVFTKVMYVAPVLSDRQEYLDRLREQCGGAKELAVSDKIPDVGEVKEFGAGHPVLLVVDDLLGFRDTSGITDLATLHSHHQGITCLFCVQNPFLRSAKLDLTTLSRNTTAKILFFQVNDWSVYRTLNSRLFPERKNFILDCLTTAKKKYRLPYIIINTDPFAQLDRRYICYTAIFKKERVQFGDSPLFFDLQAK